MEQNQKRKIVIRLDSSLLTPIIIGLSFIIGMYINSRENKYYFLKDGRVIHRGNTHTGELVRYYSGDNTVYIYDGTTMEIISLKEKNKDYNE